MSDKSLDPVVSTLESALNRASLRAAMAASNLANVDTPGYRAMDVTFDEAMNEASLEMVRTVDSHMVDTAMAEGARVVESPVTRIRSDGNTVDVDQQMTLLSQMGSRYTAVTEMVKKRFAMMIYAVTSR